MCGVAGFTNVFNNQQRSKLARQLGIAIDTRGGHAAGFLAVATRGIRYGRTTETFEDATRPFLDNAAAGPVATMLHARFATCGADLAGHAHPFAIKRDDKVKLFGMHNGTFSNHEKVARRHGREPTAVDSEELFQLLADGNYGAVSDLQGYGTACWIDPTEPSKIKLVRLSESADLEIIKIKGAGAGFVFGSTFSIIQAGMAAAGLETETAYTLPHGEVIELDGETIRFASEIPTLKVSFGYSYSGYGGWSSRSYGRGWSSYGEDLDGIAEKCYVGPEGETDGDSEDSSSTWTEKELYRLLLESGEECDPSEFHLTEDEAEEIEEEVFGSTWDSDAEADDPDDLLNDPTAWDHVEDGPEVWRQLARLEAKGSCRDPKREWKRRIAAELLKEKENDLKEQVSEEKEDNERLERYELATSKG